jgi:hypothetical protein
MIEILKFIFQDFWHFLGTFLLTMIIAGCLSRIFNITINNYYVDKKDKK